MGGQAWLLQMIYPNNDLFSHIFLQGNNEQKNAWDRRTRVELREFKFAAIKGTIGRAQQLGGSLPKWQRVRISLFLKVARPCAWLPFLLPRRFKTTFTRLNLLLRSSEFNEAQKKTEIMAGSSIWLTNCTALVFQGPRNTNDPPRPEGNQGNRFQGTV